MRTLIWFLMFIGTAAAQAPNVQPSPNPTWNWINAGVGIQVLGNSLDWATSWKQPEANSLLANTSGQYTGQLYRTGSYRKAGVSGGLTVVSYLVGWKWPRTRKWVGILNMSLGGMWAGIAFSNVARNPYYR
jgi:hypothetical protein